MLPSVFVTLVYVVGLVSGAVWTGSIETKNQFEFIERFGYSQTSKVLGNFGVLNYTITPTDEDKVTEAHHLRVVLYHGANWDKVYNTDLTCLQKLAVAKVCNDCLCVCLRVFLSVCDSLPFFFFRFLFFCTTLA
jgi:hypothetical protein